jgi:hypothetical protein
MVGISRYRNKDDCRIEEEEEEAEVSAFGSGKENLVRCNNGVGFAPWVSVFISMLKIFGCMM